MKLFSWLSLFFTVLLLSSLGCVTKPDYTNFFEYHPHSILVVPPANKTTAVDAPAIFLTTVSAAFAERGYYVFPVLLVQDILNDLGATDEGAIAAIPPGKLKTIFGAESVLYVTITDWATSYLIFAASITVAAEYRLVDTATETVLWAGQQKVVFMPGAGGGPIGALVGAAIVAAGVPYRPFAIQANNEVVRRSGDGIPAGPYHPEFQKDREQFK